MNCTCSWTLVEVGCILFPFPVWKSRVYISFNYYLKHWFIRDHNISMDWRESTALSWRWHGRKNLFMRNISIVHPVYDSLLILSIRFQEQRVHEHSYNLYVWRKWMNNTDCTLWHSFPTETCSIIPNICEHFEMVLKTTKNMFYSTCAVWVWDSSLYVRKI